MPILGTTIAKYLFKLPFTNHRSFIMGVSVSTSAACQQQQKVLVNDININYQKVGNGSYPLLCLPGALGFIESDFGPLLNKFNLSKFTVVCWDPPGYGRSRPPDREFKQGIPHMFQTDAKLAHDLMQTLGFQKFSTVGWSDGGITALVQAIQFPDSIEKMVVLGANAFVNQQDVDLYLKVRDIDNWSPKMKAPMIQMYGGAYFRKKWTEWTDAFIDHFAKRGGDICKNEVKNIKCPTLIIHGLKDRMVGLDHAEFLQKNIERSKFHLMPEGKHNLHLAFPEEFIKLVETFFLNEDELASASE